MKWYIKLLFIFSIFFLSIPSIFAADIDSFEVVLEKESAKVGEALDLTITAVDKNGKVVEDYLGDILVFSESDDDAEFPNDLSENSYSFTATNEGTIKFENAVQFSKAGVQDIYVYDINEDTIMGIAEVTITQADEVKDMEIEILSPENGITVGSNTIKVSGKTQKNYQVHVILNDTQKIPTTSNADGVFEVDVENLQEWENTLQAQVLDADDKKIGESSKVSVKINAGAPLFKSIAISPTGEVEAESEISIEVVSNIGLREVQALINDVVFTLKEEKDGIYKGKGLAPKNPWKYGVTVILKDEFSHETREANAATLIVIPALAAATQTGKIIETITPVANPVVLQELNLTITGIQVTELKTKSVVTWDALKDAESYNVYKKISETQIELIQNVKEARFEVDIVGDEIKYDDFAIKAVGRTASWEIVQGNLSDMTKVKTGPELYIILAVLALLISAGIFYLKRENIA